MKIKYLSGRICLIVLLAIAFTGCATQMPLEQQQQHALLVAVQNNSSMISKIGNNSNWTSKVNLVPGRNVRIETLSCYGSSTNCRTDLYFFEAKKGLAYIFRNPTLIEVYDRFNIDIDKNPLYSLHQIDGRKFVLLDEYASVKQQQLKNAVDDGLAIVEKRKLNLHLARKIGARICQERGQGIIYIGYVEAIADEKVKIRIADAQFKGSPNAHPGGFSPSIVWDSPMRWDLCE